jgi:hypothetical protein
VLEEQRQQGELRPRQLDPAAAAPHLARVVVELEVGETARLTVRLGAPEQGAEARLELPQRERLDQVVVGAGVQAGHPVVDRVAGGQHEHRRAVAGGPQAPAHLQPVEARHGDVEHDRVHVVVHEVVERRPPVGGDADLVAVEAERLRPRA